jgi:RNA polymerase sigma factor (sigma-70 family)
LFNRSNVTNCYWIFSCYSLILDKPGEYKNVQKEKQVELFEEVMEQYTPMLSAIIRKLHIYRDYELFRQVGKVALWQAFERFDESKGNFTPFAYRSIYGAMLDELKRESRFSGRVTVVETSTFEVIPEINIIDELPEWLDRILLSEQERALLEALFVEGRSVAELAVVHNITNAGMKKRREKVLKKVREQATKEKDFIFKI